MINHPHRSKKLVERGVIVTTQHRGVFFGYAADIDGAIIKLRAARNCLSWSSEIKGFLGLAATGPNKNCKVGPAADISLRDITSVIECTPEAIRAWEVAPWSR